MVIGFVILAIIAIIVIGLVLKLAKVAIILALGVGVVMVAKKMLSKNETPRIK